MRSDRLLSISFAKIAGLRASVLLKGLRFTLSPHNFPNKHQPKDRNFKLHSELS